MKNDVIMKQKIIKVRLADGSGRAGSMASDPTHGSGTLKDPVSYGQPGRP